VSALEAAEVAIAFSTATPVRCIEGCSGGDSGTLGIIGIVLAVVGVMIALKAWRVSDAALSIAREQHQEFLKGLRARADFAVAVELEGHPDGVVETTEDKVALEWKTKIESTGEKAATGVGINFLAPAELQDLRWEGKSASSPTTPIEKVTASDGTTYPAQYLVDLIERFGLKLVQVKFVYATVDAPVHPGEDRLVPVLFRVWSADMPDDVGMRFVESEVRIRRIDAAS
jgi:hypothetical protein